MAQQKAVLGLLPVFDLIIVQLGGNDQSASVSPAAYLSHMQSIVATIQEVYPGVDIKLVVRWDTIRPSTFPMSAYADALRKWAYPLKIPCSDFSFLLPYPLSVYASTGARALISADDTHPIVGSGSSVLAETYYRDITGGQ
jgi:lysophospholipase L1-like esterase